MSSRSTKPKDRQYLIEFNEKIESERKIICLDIDRYINNRTLLTFKCLSCGYIWKASLHNVKDRKSGCYKCRNKAIIKRVRLTEEKLSLIKDHLLRHDIIADFTNYKGSTYKYELECTKCHYKWSPIFNNIAYNENPSCPFCTKKTENIVRLYLLEKFSNYTFVKARPNFLFISKNRYLELDFFCKELSLAIEVNGIQHYKPVHFWNGEDYFNRQVENDQIKISKCLENNIKLIIIPFWEFDNIRSFLDNKLNEVLLENSFMH